MQLSTGNKKTDYHLIQRIQLKKKIDKLPILEVDVLSSFKDELKLKYKYSEDKEADLDVDFSLYKLLKTVINGYVPNTNDKQVNVKCMEFINIISQGGSKLKEIYIRDLSQKIPKQYKLSFDEDFCSYSFEVE